MYSKKLYFDDENKFKIMQIADVQEIYPASPDTLRLISLAVEREKPDLIVFTGDQIYGISPSFHMGNAYDKVKAVISQFITPIEKAGIPFAVTFGNHDDQCGISRARQTEIYAEYPHFLGGNYADENDTGTYSIPIYDSKGEQKLCICLFDTGGQSLAGEYFPVNEKQLEWFKNEREKLFEENGKYIPTVVFQHIPVPEFYNVLKRAKRFDKGAVEAFRTHKNEFYVLPDDIKAQGGFMLESPATPDKNSGQFDVLKEKGNVSAVIVGHDHNNSFAAELDGIKLIYTQCAGFNVYGPHLSRGVRTIEFNSENPGGFKTHTVTYSELTSQRLTRPVREFVLTHIPSSMEVVKRMAAAAAFSAAACLAAGAYIYTSKKNKKA